MHAAWRLEVGGRRWITEDYAVRYAPSVAALSAGRAPAARPGSTLLVTNPVGDLACSELEGAWIVRCLGADGVQVLHGPAATKEAVLSALPGCAAVHFSTHGTFDLERPLQSSVLLAQKTPLTLEELLPLLERHAPHSVVLSACETGVTQVTVNPDESLGFPAAFLHAGTRTVLATLWIADDAAAAILMGRYYREQTTGAASHAEALRRAQNWLRTVTVHELMSLLRELKDEPSPVAPLVATLRTRLRAETATTCLFAEPYYWAAFVLAGQ